MGLSKITISIPITIIFILIAASGCQSQNINFNFSGREVLFSDEFEGKNELILLNLDTKEEIKFDNFNGIDPSGFLLFNDGKNIFVNSYDVGSNGSIYIYDVLLDKKKEIDIHSKNNEMAGFTSVNICDSNFYFASLNKIFAHSLYNFELLREYTTDSLISKFSVYDNDLIAIVYNIYDNEHNGYRPSNIYLYDFKNKTSKEIPYLSVLYGWSKDRKKLLFNSRGPKILEYPSLVVKPIDAIDKDSLKIYGQMNFVGNDEIIFAGFKKGGNHFEETNLYILDLKTEKIKQITNTNTPKEIKSTDY
jgi:hypothetical protein